MKNVQVYVLVLCTFVTFAVVAQPPPAGRKPPVAIAIGIDSILTAKHLDRDRTSIVADSSLRHLIMERLIDQPQAIVFIYKIEAGQVAYNWHEIIISGSILRAVTAAQPEAFKFSAYVMEGADKLEQAPEAEIMIEDPQDGFWDSVLQPALVTLGAATIIALFFLIRS